MDILEAAVDNPELGSRPSIYLCSRSLADYTAVVTGAEIATHESPRSPLKGQPYFRLEFQVHEVNGAAIGSMRTPNGYQPVELQPGDTVSTVVEMASVGIKDGVKAANLRRLCDFAAAFSGKRPMDFQPGGTPGPLGIRDVFGDPSEHVGKKIHVFADEVNSRGYSDPRVSLVPEGKGK